MNSATVIGPQRRAALLQGLRCLQVAVHRPPVLPSRFTVPRSAVFASLSAQASSASRPPVPRSAAFTSLSAHAQASSACRPSVPRSALSQSQCTGLQCLEASSAHVCSVRRVHKVPVLAHFAQLCGPLKQQCAGQ
jgi:hypothetical protein